MRFNELSQNAENDDYGKWEIDDTRRPKLTLRHLNKMRGMKEISRVDHDERVKKLKNIYGSNNQGAE